MAAGPDRGPGAARYHALVSAGPGLVVACDFDGTLAPVVADPTRALIHPDAPGVLAALAGRARAVAVVTGRPVAQVLRLGRLEEVADRAPTGRVLVLGQYGNERWDSADRAIISPPPPEGLARLRADLPRVLADAGCADAWVEDKGLALAVHTRRLAEPEAAHRRLLGPLGERARALGLQVEPGRLVVEVRARGTDKGDAVRALVAELDARAVLFAGDDLGDVAAFRAVAALRERGMPALLVCSGSAEQDVLVELADVVTDGPGQTVAWLRNLAGDLPGPG